MELHEQLEGVVDTASFLDFARALQADRGKTEDDSVDTFGRGRAGWENHTIEDFLDAAIAWADASEFGATEGLAGSSPWKRFATFLYCGKIYE